MSKHTKEPWSVNIWPRSDAHIGIGAVGTPLVALIPLRDVSINGQKDNARRVVACVNACAGIPTEWLETCASNKECDPEILAPVVASLERQRDALLAALQRIAAVSDAGRLSYDDHELRGLLVAIRDDADSAIGSARAEPTEQKADDAARKKAEQQRDRLLRTLERIAASDPGHSKAGTLARSEAREAIEEVTGEPWPCASASS